MIHRPPVPPPHIDASLSSVLNMADGQPVLLRGMGEGSLLSGGEGVVQLAVQRGGACERDHGWLLTMRSARLAAHAAVCTARDSRFCSSIVNLAGVPTLLIARNDAANASTDRPAPRRLAYLGLRSIRISAKIRYFEIPEQ